MVRFLRLWHHVELRSLRNSAVAIVVVPLFFIIPGALFLGRASWTAKLIVLQIGIWIATILLVWLAKRRLVIGSELATALNMIEPEKEKQSLLRRLITLFTDIPEDAREGVEDYLRLVAAILSSEIAVGLIALWLPGYKNPWMTLLILPVAMALITHTIWKKGEFWWPKLVYRLAVFTLVASVVSIFFAQTVNELSDRLSIDGIMADKVREIWPTEAEKAEKTRKKAEELKRATVVEQFQLKVGEETSTVEAGPGTHHRLWANKPYQAVSVQMDGSRKLYPMPAGWESWTGAAPAGKLRLIAKEEGTIVKIRPGS